MRRRKHCGIATLFSVLVFLLSPVDRLEGQQGIAQGPPAKPEVYVVPFSPTWTCSGRGRAKSV